MAIHKQCPVKGCPRMISFQRVMCSGHWYRLPLKVRRRVWREYRHQPWSDDHLAAVRAAIAKVDELVAGS